MKPILLFLALCIMLSACKKDKKNQDDQSQISVSVSNNTTGVIFNGLLKNLKPTDLKEVGFVWSNTRTLSVNDGVSFKHGGTPTTTFTYTVTSGFTKDSVYYTKAYYLDNAGAYHYSDAAMFTSSGTKGPVISYISSYYTWGDLAKLTIISPAVANVNDVTIIINDNISLHPEKIDTANVYFKVPAALTTAVNSLAVSVYGQKSNTVSLYLVSPQIISARKSLTYNDTMTITGKYFNPQLALNKVKINNTALDVISGNTTQLVVKAASLTISDTGPLNITTGTNLTVTTNDSYNVYRYLKPLTSFPGVARLHAVAQTMNNKIYYGLGYGDPGPLKDWWEYDPATGKWTQLADYPSTAFSMLSFVLANKVFVGMGVFSNSFSSGFYAYDRQSNTWTMTASRQTYTNGSAVICNNNYAYIVGGGAGEPYTDVRIPDVWRYDPKANSWKKIGDFPGTVRESAMSFSISDKGYIIGGNTTGLQPELKDVWQFDFNTEQWKQVAGIPQEAGDDFGFAFALNTKGYIGGGVYDDVEDTSRYVYEYDPVTNTWVKKEFILDSIVYSASATSVNNIGYILGGYKYYTPSVAQGSNSFIEFIP